MGRSGAPSRAPATFTWISQRAAGRRGRKQTSASYPWRPRFGARLKPTPTARVRRSSLGREVKRGANAVMFRCFSATAATASVRSLVVSRRMLCGSVVYNERFKFVPIFDERFVARVGGSARKFQVVIGAILRNEWGVRLRISKGIIKNERVGNGPHVRQVFEEFLSAKGEVGRGKIGTLQAWREVRHKREPGSVLLCRRETP